MNSISLATPAVWTPAKAQLHFDQLNDFGLAICSNPECGEDQSSALSGEEDLKNVDEPWLSDSFELLCSACYDGRTRSHGRFYKVCNHLPRCTVSSGYLTPTKRPYGGESEITLHRIDDVKQNVPSKIQRLLQDLAQTPPGIKRFNVCFSSHVSPLTKRM